MTWKETLKVVTALLVVGLLLGAWATLVGKALLQIADWVFP